MLKVPDFQPVSFEQRLTNALIRRAVPILAKKGRGAKAAILPYEDFTTWTEEDPAEEITVEKYVITFTNFHNDNTAYVYDDKGAGYFTNFTLCLQTEITENVINMLMTQICKLSTVDPSGFSFGFPIPYVGIMWITSEISDIPLIGLVERPSLPEWYEDDSIELERNKTYYLKFMRSNTALSCEIYNDAGMTDLVDTLSLTAHDSTPFRYIYCCHNSGGGGETCSGTISNLYEI